MARWVIAGAPLAGKSTYVLARVEPGDLVFDYDLEMAKISGLPVYEHDPDRRGEVLAVRDALIAEVQADPGRTLWLITATPYADELRRLRDLVDGEVVFLEVSREEAHRRAQADRRPTAWHDYIDRFFDRTDIDPDEFERSKGMKKKTWRGAVKLGAPRGEFRAVFSTFHKIDHDGDVTLPGAFEEGQKVRISYWGHRWQDLPVGRGEIHQNDREAWVDGRFFLDTEGGKETYAVVKELDELQEWSYGFDVIDAEYGQFNGQNVQFLKKITVHEVSPVMLGAGIGTRTESIKSARMANLPPAQVLAQLRAFEGGGMTPGRALASIEVLEKATMPRTPAETQATIIEMGNPALVKRVIEDMQPTNRDRLRAAIAAELGSGFSESYVEAITDGRLAEMIDEHFRRQEEGGGVVPSYALSVEAVTAWARSPA